MTLDRLVLSNKRSTPTRRRLVAVVVLASVGVHALAAVIAGVWVIARHLAKREEPPVPATLPAVRLPTPEPERSIHPAATASSAIAQAAIIEKIQALRPGKITLPNLPKLPVFALASNMDALAPNNFLSAIAVVGDGFGGGGLGGGTGTGVSFLGVQTTAKRVVFMYDISTTVMKAAARVGMPMERIRDETAALIANLGVNTRFTMVEFARNFAFFSKDLVPATKANREAAHRWLYTYFAVNGAFPQSTPGAVSGSPGFLVALEAVFALQPDCIFVISDGSMQRGSRGKDTIPISEIETRLGQWQAASRRAADVFFIGVGVTPENEKLLRRALLHAGGNGAYSQLRREPPGR